MTTTTKENETAVIRKIDEVADELRTHDPRLGRAQAFTQVINTRRDLRRELAEARQRDTNPPDDEFTAAGQRIGKNLLEMQTYLLRKANPELTEAQATSRVLRQSPAICGLLSGRL